MTRADGKRLPVAENLLGDDIPDKTEKNRTLLKLSNITFLEIES